MNILLDMALLSVKKHICQEVDRIQEFDCTFYSLFFLIIFILTYIYIYSLVLCFIFALSIEQTCPDLHFTTDYILYNWVCDE